MALNPHFKNSLAAVAAAVSGDLLLNVTGVREVVAEAYPIVTGFFPHIGVGIGIGVLSYVILSGHHLCKINRRKNKEEDELKRNKTISDLMSLRDKIQIFRKYSSHEKKDPSLISGIDLTISKYNRWIYADLGIDALDMRVARIIEPTLPR